MVSRQISRSNPFPHTSPLKNARARRDRRPKPQCPICGNTLKGAHWLLFCGNCGYQEEPSERFRP